MKKLMIMLMAACTFAFCGAVVNAQEAAAPADAPATVQVDGSAGIHGNILDIVSDQKCSDEDQSKSKCDGKWDKCPEECKSCDCPACDKGGKCNCKCDKAKCDCCKKDCKCKCDKAKCDCCKKDCKCGDCPKCAPKCNCCDKCKCGCKEGKECSCDKAKCDCCKKDCTCGDCPACTKEKADSVHGNIVDAVQGTEKAKAKCNSGCNKAKCNCKSNKCKKGCKVKKSK